MFEIIELVHQGDKRIVVGKARAAKLPDGQLTVRMTLLPEYSSNITRARYRKLIEDYMDSTPWYRKRTYGDHIA